MTGFAGLVMGALVPSMMAWPWDKQAATPPPPKTTTSTGFFDLLHHQIKAIGKTLGLVENGDEMPLFLKIAIPSIALFFACRIAQRVYYTLRGHRYDWFWSWRPRYDMENFLKENEIVHDEHSFISTRQGCSLHLKYRRLGTGKKIVLMVNGVGTDFFMWLPTLSEMMKKNPKVFEEMTLIAPSYRGLFGSDACPTPPTAAATEIIPPSVAGQLLSYANPVAFFSGSGNAIQSLLGGVESATSSPGKTIHEHAGDTSMPSNATTSTSTTTAAVTTTSPSKNETITSTTTNEVSVKPVEITMALCADDIKDVMRHAKVSQFHTIVGWSLGAQVALTCVAKYPHVTDQLFLLNPSTGETVGCSFQTVFPLPKVLRTLVSQVIFGAIDVLLPLIPTSIWVGLKSFFLSSAFRIILELVAFFGGFPPEQPPYFQEYMRDVFNSQNQTRGLLLLIKSLDEPLPDAAMTLPHKTQIISGLPDTMTGVFNAFRLHSSMPNSKHVMFTMASHFLLIEWPDQLAEELLNQIMA